MEKDRRLLKLRETVIETSILMAEKGQFDEVKMGVEIVHRLDCPFDRMLAEAGSAEVDSVVKGCESDTERFLKTKQANRLDSKQQECLEEEWRTAQGIADVFGTHAVAIRKEKHHYRTKPNSTPSGAPELFECLSYILHTEHICRTCFEDAGECSCK